MSDTHYHIDDIAPLTYTIHLLGEKGVHHGYWEIIPLCRTTNREPGMHGWTEKMEKVTCGMCRSEERRRRGSD